MECKERVIRAIQMSGPDRPPRRDGVWPGARAKYGDALLELYRRYPSDVLFVRSLDEHEDAEFPPLGQTAVDRWGCRWARASEDSMGYVVEHPLADWSSFKEYHIPEPLWSDFDRVRNSIEEDTGRHYVLVDGGQLVQRLWRLRGMENVFVDLAEECEELYTLRDGILDFNLRRLDRWAGTKVDGIFFRDDWGTQTGLMINPSLWRAFFKPAYRRMFSAAHEVGAFVHFHSDGVVRDIILHLIDLGVDVLNVQATLMGIQDLGRELAGRVCVEGDLDRQVVLPYGSTDEVAAHVHEYVGACGGRKGGFIGFVEVSPSVPLTNLEAALRTLWEYEYP